MPERQYTALEERTITVRIFRSLEADYRRRGVFPALRMTPADRLAGRSSSLLEVSVDVAKDVFADAMATRYGDASAPRCAKAAYTRLGNELGPILKGLECEGTVPDPGFQHVWQEYWTDRSLRPAQFQVGDLCLIWRPGEARHNTVAVIGEGFYLYAVREPHGLYWREREQVRISYRWGYICRTTDGREVFYPASDLRNPNGEVRHLRLVAPCR